MTRPTPAENNPTNWLQIALILGTISASLLGAKLIAQQEMEVTLSQVETISTTNYQPAFQPNFAPIPTLASPAEFNSPPAGGSTTEFMLDLAPIPTLAPVQIVQMPAPVAKSRSSK